MSKSIAALAGLLINISSFEEEAPTVHGFVQAHLPAAFQADVLTALTDERLHRAQRLAQSEETPLKSAGLRPPSTLLLGAEISSYYLPAKPLELHEDVIFPVKQSPSDYASLWRAFIQAVDSFQHETDLLTYIESLQDVMKRHLWCVPGDQPDVSLYDQCRITAAIATCLWEAQTDDEVGYLVAGDISGIQKFIFQVISKGATKQLRARSLYLQLLTEGAARYILRQLELPITSLIYAGGGHFYLLAPTAYGEKQTVIRRYLDDMLLNHHDGDLYLSLGAVAMTITDLADHQHYQSRWTALRLALNTAKARRFADSRTGNDLLDVFQPRNEYDEARREFRKRATEREQQADIDEDAVTKSAMYDSFRRFSEQARDMMWLVLAEIEPETTSAGTMQAALKMLGLGFTVVGSKSRSRNLDMGSAMRVIALRVQDEANESDLHNLDVNCPVAISTRYMVNATARSEADGKEEYATFSELQRASRGINRLGVLRMDVDDLGAIFGGGIKRTSLARSAGLSFNMGLFFEGWVAELCRRMNNDPDQRRESTSDETEAVITVEPLYAVYSGGDDLFIVGVWDMLPKLAQQIHDDFARYACHNPKMHISAGVTLHVGKYPLYQAAEDADHALDAAKEITGDTLEVGQGKDAITFLGETVKWSRWGDVIALSDRIETIMTSAPGRRSIAQILLQLHERYTYLVGQLDENGNKGQLVWGRWMWQSAYLLARFAERHKESRADVDWIRARLADDIPPASDRNTPFRGIEIVGLAARWAEARTRKKENKEQSHG